MAADQMGSPLFQALQTMRDDLERRSNERKAARAMATQQTMDALARRADQEEAAEVEKLAVSMSGRAGQDYARGRNGASRMAQDAVPDDVPAPDDDESGGLEAGDIDELAMREEEDSLGEQVGNRMSGKAVGEAALQQRKDFYRASEHEPFAGSEEQRGRARLAQAANTAREDVNQADAMSDVRRQMSNGFTSANSPTAAMSPMKAKMMAELEAAKTNPYGVDPQKAQLLAQLAQIQPDGTMGQPPPAARQLDAAMAPVAQLAAMPPAPMPQIPPTPQMGGQPPMDPGFMAYLNSIRPMGQ